MLRGALVLASVVMLAVFVTNPGLSPKIEPPPMFELVLGGEIPPEPGPVGTPIDPDNVNDPSKGRTDPRIELATTDGLGCFGQKTNVDIWPGTMSISDGYAQDLPHWLIQHTDGDPITVKRIEVPPYLAKALHVEVTGPTTFVANVYPDEIAPELFKDQFGFGWECAFLKFEVLLSDGSSQTVSYQTRPAADYKDNDHYQHYMDAIPKVRKQMQERKLRSDSETKEYGDICEGEGTACEPGMVPCKTAGTVCVYACARTEPNCMQHLDPSCQCMWLTNGLNCCTLCQWRCVYCLDRWVCMEEACGDMGKITCDLECLQSQTK